MVSYLTNSFVPGMVYRARIVFCLVSTAHLAGRLALMFHEVPEALSVPEQLMRSAFA